MAAEARTGCQAPVVDKIRDRRSRVVSGLDWRIPQSRQSCTADSARLTRILHIRACSQVGAPCDSYEVQSSLFQDKNFALTQPAVVSVGQ